MKCPECGDKDAIEVELLTSFSCLCVNQACGLFDFDHAMDVCKRAFDGVAMDILEDTDTWLESLLPDD